LSFFGFVDFLGLTGEEEVGVAVGRAGGEVVVSMLTEALVAFTDLEMVGKCLRVRKV
jgi:hypothetical protein